MSAPNIEFLFRQSRAATEIEIEEFFNSIYKFLCDRNLEILTSGLQQMFLLLHSSKKTRKIPKHISEAILSILLITPQVSSTLRTLCREILREMAPFIEPEIKSVETCRDNQNIPDILAVFISQGPKYGHFDNIVGETLQLVMNNKMDGPVRIKSLAFLGQMAHLPSKYLSKVEREVISFKMAEFFRNASIYQGPNPYSSNLFSKRKSEHINFVTEVDGTPSKDLFTVLSIGNYYFDNQMLSIQCFSILKKWLTFLDDDSGSSRPASSISSVSDRTSLKDVSVEYCIRLLDQCERKALDPHNSLLQIACLGEVVSLLDVICLQEQNLVARTYDIMKRIYRKVVSENIYLTVLVPVMQFFFNHSHRLEHDSQDVYRYFFTTVLSNHYHHPIFTYQVVTFLLKNFESLRPGKNEILCRYFPNILKILAWNPHAFLIDFSEILSSMISLSTALEVFHTLLDLPCMTALLELNSKEFGTMNDPLSRHLFQNPEYIPLFNFVLRDESGSGDTINKLNLLHSLVADFRQHPRVVCCSQALVPLIRQYFRIVLESMDSSRISKLLLPAMLDRIRLIYPEPIYVEEIKEIFSEELLTIMKLYPFLAVELHTEILEYLCSVRKTEQFEKFFSHMIWVIGEFTSPKFNNSCTPDIITRNYEMLEPMTYEIHGSLIPSDQQSYRLITILISTLAKLAAHCQDLLPRVLLCLSKIVNHTQGDHNSSSRIYTVERAKELICLLKLPNVASMILSPSPDVEVQSWHREVTALPLILKSTATLLQRE